jgi:hypothetical protein
MQVESEPRPLEVMLVWMLCGIVSGAGLYGALRVVAALLRALGVKITGV